ncbi:MAG: hypothetical protein R6W73_00600 [Candidatus Saliniplasma sp.]
MVKGNIRINKSEARRVEDGKIVKDLPLINYNGDLLPLFKVISPSHCKECGSKLHINKSRKRYVLSSYETIEIPVNYWQCSNEDCDSYYTDDIVGVTGSKNYSDEYLDKLFHTRYNSKTSLFNTRKAGEILTGNLGEKTRTACPSTLWKYDQEKGSISLEKLRNTNVQFDGTIYCDGYWVKNGWRKFLEKSRGREFDESEWKRVRYKSIYVVATSDKVVLDFAITERRPPYFVLIPLFSRIKKRFDRNSIKKIVSDEDSAIINAVSNVLPDIQHSFCVFHQLKNLSRIYLDDFRYMDKVPEKDKIFYEIGKKLIMSESVVESTAILKKLEKMLKKGLTHTSKRAMKFLKDKYNKNRKLLEKGFSPETNNVMEQLFSFINDFVFQARSFKILSGLKNWASNLFYIWNNREFNTGKLAGLSPLQISKRLKPG